jgi:RimJ/RimL family protein N-acetyltransferase
VIRIREAEPGDARGLVDLAQSVGREPGAFLLTTESWRGVAEERRFIKSLRRNLDALLLVVDDRGVIVGRLSVARDPHPASRHVADLGLMVAAEYRRRGIGIALLDRTVDWARAMGVRKLELHVFPWNEPAIALYEKYGFEREGLRRRHYVRDGDEVDAILMAYRVEPS